MSEMLDNRTRAARLGSNLPPGFCEPRGALVKSFLSSQQEKTVIKHFKMQVEKAYFGFQKFAGWRPDHFPKEDQA